MLLRNPWVGYLDRSHIKIKNSVLKRLGETTPEITDHSESNILVVIVSIFSGIAEMLNYYIDNMAREAFITTARKYSSVVRHTRLIDYRIKAIVPATVDLQIKLKDPAGNILALENVELLDDGYIIPLGTRFTTNNNIPFISTKDYIGSESDTIITLPVEQKTLVEDILLGETDGTDDQLFNLGLNYVHNSIILRIGGETWERKETLGRSGPEDKHYIVDISVEKEAYVRFGDNVNGRRPDPNLDVYADIYTSLGSAGNVDSETITQSDFDFSSISSNIGEVEITNTRAAVGGTDYEDIDRIRRSAPLSLRTLDRAVTRQDYIDIAKLAPGVDKATLHYSCGKRIKIYISPNDGGIAQTLLLENTKNFIDERKMVTTFVDVLPAGESYIFIELDVKARFRRDAISTKADIVKELVRNYEYSKSDVNRNIRRSDIIALVDNLEKVDYLSIVKMYLIPYFRPLNTFRELVKYIAIRNGSDAIVNWSLQFDGIRMRLSMEGQHIANIDIGQSYIDPQNIFEIIISDNSYETGEEWHFTTYPINSDLEVRDFSVPVLREENLIIQVTEQYSM